MMSNITCTITITETDGRLDIMANIPEAAANTIAGSLAMSLIRGAQEIMAQSTGQDKAIVRLTRN